MLSWLDQLGKILISSETNIRRLKKKLEKNKSVLMLRHDIKYTTQKALYTVHSRVQLLLSQTTVNLSVSCFEAMKFFT
jgi:hypothetical protein